MVFANRAGMGDLDIAQTENRLRRALAERTDGLDQVKGFRRHLRRGEQRINGQLFRRCPLFAKLGHMRLHPVFQRWQLLRF